MSRTLVCNIIGADLALFDLARFIVSTRDKRIFNQVWRVSDMVLPYLAVIVKISFG